MQRATALVTYEPDLPAYQTVRTWVCGVGGCTGRHPAWFHNMRARWLRHAAAAHFERTVRRFRDLPLKTQYDLIRLHGLERTRWDVFRRALTGKWL